MSAATFDIYKLPVHEEINFFIDDKDASVKVKLPQKV